MNKLGEFLEIALLVVLLVVFLILMATRPAQATEVITGYNPIQMAQPMPQTVRIEASPVLDLQLPECKPVEIQFNDSVDISA